LDEPVSIPDKNSYFPVRYHVEWVLGALFLVVRRPDREADHSSPSTAKINNEWSFIFIFPYAFMA
jgi:hypothetical protein